MAVDLKLTTVILISLMSRLKSKALNTLKSDAYTDESDTGVRQKRGFVRIYIYTYYTNVIQLNNGSDCRVGRSQLFHLQFMA